MSEGTQKTSQDFLVEALLAKPELRGYKANLVKKTLDEYPNLSRIETPGLVSMVETLIPQLSQSLITALGQMPAVAGNFLHPHSVSGRQYWLSKSILEVVADNTQEEAHEAACGTLARSTSETIINEICQTWANTRHSGLEEIILEKEWVGGKSSKARILTALLTDTPINIDSEEEIRVLAKLGEATGKDRGFIKPAKQCLLELKTGHLPKVEAVWKETFSPILLEVLQKNNYRPDINTEAGFWLAMLLPEYENEILEGDAQLARYLANALNSTNPTLRERAAELLPKMKLGLAKTELCWLAVQTEQPFIEHVAVRNGWQPYETYQRALFYFVTGQYEKYDELDFDGRILRMSYQTAEPNFRQRLISKIRAAGKAQYLTAITGGVSKQRAEELNSEEAGILVKTLTQQADWQGLWELVPVVPLKWSVEAVRRLADKLGDEWQPGSDTEAIVNELAVLVYEGLLVDEKEVDIYLPLLLAASQNHLKLGEETNNQARLHELAFSPKGSTLAIAAGSKVLLWNIQTGTIEHVIKCADDHQIRALIFAADGTLCFGSGSNTATFGSVYRWKEGQAAPEKMGQHDGGVITLKAWGERFVISTGRDGRIILWDVESGQAVQQAALGFGNWPRQISISADGQLLAAFYENINIYRLPDLTLLSENNLLEYGIVQQGCFTPDNSGLVLSKQEAYLRSVKFRDGYKLDSVPLVHKDFAMQGANYLLGVEPLPASGYMLNITDKGLIEIMDWGAYRKIGEYKVELTQASSHYAQNILTTYSLAPNGAFIGTVDTELNLTLLDIRPLTIRRLFSIPLARVGLTYLEAIAALRNIVDSEITPEVDNALLYIETVVRRLRLRYAIELDEVPMLRVGEFDIELELDSL